MNQSSSPSPFEPFDHVEDHPSFQPIPTSPPIGKFLQYISDYERFCRELTGMNPQTHPIYDPNDSMKDRDRVDPDPLARDPQERLWELVERAIEKDLIQPAIDVLQPVVNPPVVIDHAKRNLGKIF